MQPQLEFNNSLQGMKSFLRQCRSTSMATSVGQSVDEAIRDNKLDPQAPLTEASLESVRQKLFERDNRDSTGQSDVLLALADVMMSGGDASSNPFESRLQFVERLQQQLRDGEKINFQRAFTEAQRG